MSQPTLRQLIPRLWQHITSARRIQTGLLLLLMILTTFSELIALGAVLPFLGVLTTPDQVFAHPMAQPLIQILGINDRVILF